MARGRRHGLIDPKATPARSTERNRKKRRKIVDSNTSIIRKYQAQLQKEQS